MRAVSTSNKRAKEKANRKFRRRTRCDIGLYTELQAIDLVDEEGEILPVEETNLPKSLNDVSDTWDFPSDGLHGYDKATILREFVKTGMIKKYQFNY